MSNYPEIFLSYAWRDKNGQGAGRERIVDELYASLSKDNFRVVRDKTDLKYTESISEFMQRIGKSKYVIVVISEKYVESSNCMFELHEIARDAKFEKKQFQEKILPVMAESIDFSRAEILDKYASFWKEKAGLPGAGENEENIENHFKKLMTWISDMNTLTLEQLSSDDFAIIKNAIKDKWQLNPIHQNFWGKLKIRPVFWITSVSAMTLLISFTLYERSKTAAAVNIPAPSSSLIITGNAGEQLLIVKDKRTNLYGYARMKDTNLIVSCKYQMANPFADGMALVKIDNKYKWIKPDSADAFQGEYDFAANFKAGESKVIRGRDTFYINMDGKRVPDGVGTVVVNNNPKPKTPVINHGGYKRHPTDSIVITMCKAICDTKGITGVEVSFRDPQNKKKYSQVSNGNEMEFNVPCDLMEESIMVTFIKNGQADYRNIMLKAFEIPSDFKNY